MHSSQPLTGIKEGSPAPKFSLPAYPSGTVSLDQFHGKKNVILAFYPKDDTPGCTKEACAFTEDLSHFENANTEVLSISCDDLESHGKFAQKYNLKQQILVDEGGKVAIAYGAMTPGKTNASRVLFIIDKNGIIKHIHEGMPENQKILEILRKI